MWLHMHFSIYGPIQADSKLCLAEQRRLMTKPPTIFVVDHDAAVRDSLSVTLTFSGFKVRGFQSGSAFLQSLPLREDGCLLVEFDLEDMTGMELIARLSDDHVSIPIVIMSARLRLPFPKTEFPKNVAILQKPFGRDELLNVLQHALARK